MSKDRGIGPVPEGIGEALHDFLTQLRGRVTAGNSTGAFSGSFSGSSGSGAGGGTIVIPGGPGDGYTPDYTPPPTPTGVNVVAGIDFVGITTDAPTFSQGNGYARTIVYGAKYGGTGPLPTFANAVIVHEFVGQVGSFPTDPATQWHIWLKWRTRDAVDSVSPAGGANGFQVTTGQDVTKLLQILSGQITESQLYTSLNQRINLIDGAAGLTGSVNARIKTEEDARVAQDALIASRITTLNASNSGGALTDDPEVRAGFEFWDVIINPGGASIVNGSLTGRKAFRASTDTWVACRYTIPVDRNKQYTARGRFRAGGSVSSLRTAYLFVDLFDSSGARIAGDGTFWHYSAASGTHPGTDWVDWSTTFGGGSSRTFPTNAAFMRVGAGLMYNDARPNGGWMEAESLAIYDAEAAMVGARLTVEESTRASADTALAQQITTLSSTVTTNNNTLTAALQTESSTRVSVDGWMSSQYVVRTQLTQGGRTVMGGFGLMGTSNPTQGPTIDFGVLANKFWIGPPAGTTGVSDILPFIVQTTEQVVNGVTIPRGVYMDSAYIRDLTAVVARMGNAWITSAMIASLAATKITSGTIAVGEQIQSSNYVNGVSGWMINGNGGAEFGFANIRGTLLASQVAAGLITATMIDSRGLDIRDNAGNIILSANSPLTAQYINARFGGNNLIGNSGFMRHSSGLPNGWGPYNNAGISITTSVSSGGQFGTNFYRITANASGATEFGIYVVGGSPERVIDWVPGQWFCISFWARSAGSLLVGSRVSALFSNMGFTPAAILEDPQLQNGVWQRWSARVQPASNASTPNGELYISVIGGAPSGAAWDICAVKVEPGEFPTAWSPAPREKVGGDNRITAANASVFIDNAAIGAAQIGSLNVGVISTALNGGNTTGNYMTMETNVIKVFSGGVKRVQIGNLLA